MGTKDRLYLKTGRFFHLLSPGPGFQLVLWACVTVTVITTLNTLLLLLLWLLLFTQTVGVRRIQGLKEARVLMFSVSCQSPGPGYPQKYTTELRSDLLLALNCICHAALLQKK